MPIERRMKIVSRLFLIAGIYGLLAIAPLYLRAPGLDSGRAVQFLYAFAGAAGATQIVYLLIARDVRRYRPLMPVGVLSKVSFAVPCLLLIGQGRLERAMLPFAIIDLLLAAAFVAAWVWTRETARR